MGIKFPLMGIDFLLMGNKNELPSMGNELPWEMNSHSREFIEFPLMRNTEFLQGWSAIHLPETHGEEHLVVMLKGLYTDLGALKKFGDWLEDTG